MTYKQAKAEAHRRWGDPPLSKQQVADRVPRRLAFASLRRKNRHERYEVGYIKYRGGAPLEQRTWSGTSWDEAFLRAGNDVANNGDVNRMTGGAA